MSRPDHDRDVLFGVLAWQTGLVERAPLLAAMYDSAVGGRSDLPNLLRERGLLTDADAGWLTSAINRQLAKNDGDAKRTLAGIEAVNALHHELDRAGVSPDGQTLAAPSHVDAAGRTRADVHTVAQPSDLEFEVGKASPASSQVAASRGGDDKSKDALDQRFRVLRTHARGGLGEVFVAEDTELKRDVALKQILPRQAGNQTSRARFLLEAEITGNLEHPGVVPVYALGSGDDGCPYYAMRFIRGESLEDAIQSYHSESHWDDPAAKALQLRELLQRFVAVCHTMEYAHSRGIIHRDIKPENIMLGRYGETLLVDWGLARPYRDIKSELDADDDLGGLGAEPQMSQSAARPTQMGSVVGTPQFMSPEQAAGKLDQMGPAADVYSLGATLYCLLTDRPPFTASDVRRVLLDVHAGNFLPPRQVRREVPPALEAVCLKAMKHDPKDRYASARALGADIERWLADESVSCYHEPPIEHVQRWMRRHKTSTQAAAIAVVLIAVVTGVAYVREAGLRTDLQTSLEKEAAARTEADAARSSAENHARRAEQQGALALGTLKTVLFDIQTRLKNLPATHTVRRDMLDTVVDGLQQVTRSFETATEADQSLVKARLDIGDIFLNTGTGEGSGALQLAEQQYQKAMETAERLRTDPARREQAEIDLAAAYQRLGDVAMQRGQWSTGVQRLRQSLELREELAGRRPDDLKTRADLAASVQRLGLVHQLQGESDEATKLFRRFLDLCLSLHDADPKNDEYARNLSVAHERLGDAAMRSGDLAGAATSFGECERLRRELVAKDVESPAAKRDLSVTLDRLADVAQEKGDNEAADKLLSESLEIRKALFELDSENLQTLRDLGVSYVRLGDSLLARNRNREAAEYFEFYSEIAAKLSKADPANIQYRRDLAAAHDRRSQAALRLNDVGAAAEAARSRVGLLSELNEADPENADGQRELSAALRDLGDVEQQLGDLAAARATADRYLQLARQRLTARQADETLLRVEADACFRAGAAALVLGDFKAAEPLLVEATAKALKAAESRPQDVAAWTTLANFESAAWQLAWESRDADAAVKRAESLIEHLKKLRGVVPAAEQKPYDDWIREAEGRLAASKEAQQVAAEARSSTLLPEEPELIDFRAAALARSGDLAAARKEVERIAGASDAAAPELFVAVRRLARIYGSSPAAEQEPIGKRCLELLTKCYELGMFRSLEAASRLEFGAEFRELNRREDLKKLLDKIRADNRPATKGPDRNATT